MYQISSVCMLYYVCRTITFESLDVGSSHMHMRHTSMDYGSYMKVIRSKSQKPKRMKIPFSAITPLSIKHRAMMFVCIMGFSGTADQMV